MINKANLKLSSSFLLIVLSLIGCGGEDDKEASQGKEDFYTRKANELLEAKQVTLAFKSISSTFEIEVPEGVETKKVGYTMSFQDKSLQFQMYFKGIFPSPKTVE